MCQIKNKQAGKRNVNSGEVSVREMEKLNDGLFLERRENNAMNASTPRMGENVLKRVVTGS